MNKKKVFGIGWGKTGTKTLAKSLQILGYSHSSLNMNLVSELINKQEDQAFEIASQQESFDDLPWNILYKELDRRFPGSKFILTIREERPWLNSYRNMVSNHGDDNPLRNKVRQFLYGKNYKNLSDNELIDIYNNHNLKVLEYFNERENDLLVVNWQKGSGWAELCEFLDVEIPRVALPHMNKGRYS